MPAIIEMDAPTKAELQLYHEKNEERLHHQRLADAAERDCATVKSKIVKWHAAEAKRLKSTTFTFMGFEFSLGPGRINVSWKDWFIKVAGAAKAVEVQNSTPKTHSLVITKLATKRSSRTEKSHS